MPAVRCSSVGNSGQYAGNPKLRIWLMYSRLSLILGRFTLNSIHFQLCHFVCLLPNNCSSGSLYALLLENYFYFSFFLFGSYLRFRVPVILETFFRACQYSNFREVFLFSYYLTVNQRDIQSQLEEIGMVLTRILVYTMNVWYFYRSILKLFILSVALLIA